MNLDRDLRDALRPLAGDPVADAKAVLARLPGAPPSLPLPPPRPWLPWTLLGIGLGVGVVIGVLVSGRGADREPPTVAPQQPEQPLQTEKEKETEKEKPTPVDPMMERELWLQVMAFGPIELDEPGQGIQRHPAGPLMTLLGTRFTTGDESQVGAYVFANDARYRLDRDSAATLDTETVRLASGRLWLECGDHDVTIQVETALAITHVAAGSAIVTSSRDTLEVLALQGGVTVRTARGETVQVQSGHRVLIDADRGASVPEEVPFLGELTSWMTTMIIQSSDPKELEYRVDEMVRAWDKGVFRDAARRELQRLGPSCVWQLADSAQKRAARDPAYALATAQLIAQILDYRSAPYALPLLELDDVELRLVVFRAVRDRTGTTGGTNEAFWRDAGLDRRREGIRDWQKELRGR